jgi:hypothetical protein
MLFSVHTVQTVAAVLHQGEHLPKMQNDTGHKSKLRMLRQRGGKEAGGRGGRWLPCRAVMSRAVPGHAARGSAWRCVLHDCLEFKPDQIRQIRQRQCQKHLGELKPTSFRSPICHSTNCATHSLCIIPFLTQHSSSSFIYSLNIEIITCWPRVFKDFFWHITIKKREIYDDNLYTIHYTVQCTLLYYTILYYTILYYTILYYTILYYTILYYTMLYYTLLYYNIKT